MNAVVAIPNSPVAHTTMLLRSHQSSLCRVIAFVSLFTFAIAFTSSRAELLLTFGSIISQIKGQIISNVYDFDLRFSF